MFGQNIVYLRSSQSQSYLSEVNLISSEDSLDIACHNEQESFFRDTQTFREQFSGQNFQIEDHLLSLQISSPIFYGLYNAFWKLGYTKNISLIFSLLSIIFSFIVLLQLIYQAIFYGPSLLEIILTFFISFWLLRIEPTDKTAITKYIKALENLHQQLLNNQQMNLKNILKLIQADKTIKQFLNMLASFDHQTITKSYKELNQNNEALRNINQAKNLIVACTLLKQIAKCNKISFGKPKQFNLKIFLAKISNFIYQAPIKIKFSLQFSIVEFIVIKSYKRLLAIQLTQNLNIKSDSVILQNNQSLSETSAHRSNFFYSILLSEIVHQSNLQASSLYLPLLEFLKLQISMKNSQLKNNLAMKIDKTQKQVKYQYQNNSKGDQEVFIPKLEAKKQLFKILESNGKVYEQKDVQNKEEIQNLKHKLNEIIRKRIDKQQQKDRPEVEKNNEQPKLYHRQIRTQGFGKLVLPKINLQQNYYIE